MGRQYAGILGPLASGIILARGVLHGCGVEATLLTASGGLFLFATIGWLAGSLADRMVRESVRTQFQSALAAWKLKEKNRPLPGK